MLALASASQEEEEITEKMENAPGWKLPPLPSCPQESWAAQHPAKVFQGTCPRAPGPSGSITTISAAVSALAALCKRQSNQ